MATKKLTLVQSKVLSQMRSNAWLSAYDLGTSLATLNALFDKGLLYRKHLTGSSLAPRITIVFCRKTGGSNDS